MSAQPSHRAARSIAGLRTAGVDAPAARLPVSTAAVEIIDGHFMVIESEEAHVDESPIPQSKGFAHVRKQ